jgi:hypothetical protein
MRAHTAANAAIAPARNVSNRAMATASTSCCRLDNDEQMAALLEAERAAVASADKENFLALLDIANLRKDDLTAAEAAANHLLLEMARIQREITSLSQPPAQSIPRTQRASPAQISHRTDSQEAKREKEHRAMIDIVLKISKSNSDIDPQLIALLGQPEEPKSRPRPADANLDEFLAANHLTPPIDLLDSIKMASLGNYEYLVMNHLTGTVEVKVYTPWHELNKIISDAFIQFKCSELTDTCMRAFTTTTLGVLLCGSHTANDTFSALLTRCNVSLKFAGNHSHLITTTTIHEKLKKVITSTTSISNDMLTYDRLIASDKVDTAAMVKKADELVRTFNNASIQGTTHDKQHKLC